MRCKRAARCPGFFWCMLCSDTCRVYHSMPWVHAVGLRLLRLLVHLLSQGWGREQIQPCFWGGVRSRMMCVFCLLPGVAVDRVYCRVVRRRLWGGGFYSVYYILLYLAHPRGKWDCSYIRIHIIRSCLVHATVYGNIRTVWSLKFQPKTSLNFRTEWYHEHDSTTQQYVQFLRW